MFLFNSEEKPSQIHGEIISFIDSESEGLFSDKISNTNFLRFDKNKYKFFLKNPNDNLKSAFVIIEEHYDSNSLKLSNIEMIPITDIIIIKNGYDSLQKKFLENFNDIILKSIIDECKLNQLNSKGIYFVFLIISKLINNFSKEQIMRIFEFVWNYYLTHKAEEDEFEFISFELIENIIHRRILNFSQNHKNIKNEINNNDNLIKEFTYIIKKMILLLNLIWII